MERTDDHKPTYDNLKHPQLIYLKRKLKDLEDVHREGKKSHATVVEHLKTELERDRKSNKEQAERIFRLKKHCESSESRVKDLKKTVSSCQLEVRELQHKLRCMEQLVEKQSDTAETPKADARKKCNLQEKNKQIAELQCLLAEEKERTTAAEAKSEQLKSSLEEEIRDARAKRVAVEQKLEQACAQLKEAESNYNTLRLTSTSSSEKLSARMSQLQESLRLAVAEYGRLSSSTTSLKEALKLECARLRLRIVRLERKLANSDEQVYELALLNRQTQTANALLSDQLRETEEELSWRTAESRFIATHTSVPVIDDSLYSEVDAYLVEQQSCREEEQAQLRNVVQNQFKLYRMNSTQLIEHLSIAEHAISREQAEVSRLKGKQADTDIVVTRLSSEGEAQKKELGQLSDKNAGYVNEIFMLQAKLEETRDALTAAETRAKAEVIKRDEILRKEKELTSRLHSTVQKSKMAEDALRAEIEQLSEELVGADAYREAYQSIAEEMRGLVARNALAEEEANRLSKFNAEILSHRNPTQKIYYVDRIRKELTDTKQKLAMSTRDHKNALAENAFLRGELGMYKSVAVPFEGKPRTNMTRVRRVPLSAQNSQAPKEEIFDTHTDLAQYLPDATVVDMTIDELS